MASAVIILECVDYKKQTIPAVILYEERKLSEGIVYTSPGGSKEKKETFLEAAIRETEEEAFLKIPQKLLIQSGGPEGLVIENGHPTHFWIVKLEDIKRDEYLKARFCNENLKRYQKETHDLTKVSLSEFKNAIRNKEKFVTDLGGRKLKLRRAFYKCLITNDKLLKKIDEIMLKHPCK